jgi:hypothetical protein
MGLQVSGVRSAGINHHFEQVSKYIKECIQCPHKAWISPSVFEAESYCVGLILDVK